MQKATLNRKPMTVDGQRYTASITATSTEGVGPIPMRVTIRAEYGHRSVCIIRGLASYERHYYSEYDPSTGFLQISPRVIVGLIRLAHARGWVPALSRSNVEIEVQNSEVRHLMPPLIVNFVAAAPGEETRAARIRGFSEGGPGVWEQFGAWMSHRHSIPLDFESIWRELSNSPDCKVRFRVASLLHELPGQLAYEIGVRLRGDEHRQTREMARNALIKRRKDGERHLRWAHRSLSTPTEEVASFRAIETEFFAHLKDNTLELALNKLEKLGVLAEARAGFWIDLIHAAENLELLQRIPYLKQKGREAFLPFVGEGCRVIWNPALQ